MKSKVRILAILLDACLIIMAVALFLAGPPVEGFIFYEVLAILFIAATINFVALKLQFPKG